MRRPGGSRRSGVVKRALDLVLCLLAAPVTLPLGAAIAVAVRLTSPGPVFYRAHRVGRDMRPLTVLKFRTMVQGSAGPAVTRAGDPRITPLGRVLRASKLDELPQLINVLRGEMSLVGPRPEDPRYVATYDAEQRQVLSVRPGVTSLAFLRFGDEQAFIERAGPADTEAFYVDRVLPEKLRIELGYVQQWTLRGDLRILARTVGGLLG